MTAGDRSLGQELRMTAWGQELGTGAEDGSWDIHRLSCMCIKLFFGDADTVGCSHRSDTQTI